MIESTNTSKSLSESAKETSAKNTVNINTVTVPTKEDIIVLAEHLWAGKGYRVAHIKTSSSPDDCGRCLEMLQLRIEKGEERFYLIETEWEKGPEMLKIAALLRVALHSLLFQFCKYPTDVRGQKEQRTFQEKKSVTQEGKMMWLFKEIRKVENPVLQNTEKVWAFEEDTAFHKNVKDKESESIIIGHQLRALKRPEPES